MKQIYLFAILICSPMCPILAQNKSLTIKEFAEKLDKAVHPQILDARSPEEFTQNRIKGAINVNLADSIALKNIVDKLKPHYPTFTYSINTGRSTILAKKLLDQGFKEVYALPGGLANWVGSGYPLETSKGSGLTTEQFKQLTQSDKLVLIDFGSKYCGGCRRLIPVLDSLKNENQKGLKIVRLELDENPGLIKEQKIEVLPTLLLFKQGKPVWKNKGFITASALFQKIQEHIE
ncbi:thioredoxin domain-containing protein [Parabacteroides sp. Marseille-P3160]|uniref:thioredoxin domain-containing protein n=1 Tax=Parabacteroides sp. Marseille-P3160 TaxID=1917887 RepID=UPI0009BA21DA|nr:thioredoxin domain-containing protein [Parabacteroides sp. Marseille-P3160]